MSKIPKICIRNTSVKSDNALLKVKDLLQDTISKSGQIARKRELEIMRDAHTLLINKQINVDQKANNPKENFEDFINYTDVNEMVSKCMKPINDELPKLRAIIAEQGQKINSQILITKQIHKQLEAFSIKQKEIITFNSVLNNVQENIRMENGQNKLKFELQDDVNNRIQQSMVETNALIDIQRANIEGQNGWLQNFKENMNKNQEILQHRFDQWHQSIEEEQKKQFTKINDLELGIEITNGRQGMFQIKLMEQFNNAIKKLSIDKKIDDKRYDDLNRLVKQHTFKMGSVEGLKSTVEYLVEDMQSSVISQNFLTKSLPVLIHLQICEALQRTVGQEYVRPLHDYEVSKTNEIEKYLYDRSSTKCIKLMNIKLDTYMKFMAKNQLGTVRFTYGEDIHKDMTHEELEYMNQVYDQVVKEKGKRLQNQENAYQDVLEQLKIDTDLQSITVLGHKLKRLEPYQLKNLFLDFVNYKVSSLDKFDDFLIHETEEEKRVRNLKNRKITKGDDQMKIPPMKSNVVKQFPDKLFVIHSDKKKPYKLLDQKFQKVFEQLIQENQKVKMINFSNFEKLTKMVLANSNEMTIVKSVFEQFQTEVDEREQLQKDTLLKLQEENQIQSANIDKKISTNSLEINQLKSKIVSCQKMVFENQSKNEMKGNEISFSVGQNQNNISQIIQVQKELEAKTQELIKEQFNQLQQIQHQHPKVSLLDGPKLDGNTLQPSTLDLIAVQLDRSKSISKDKPKSLFLEIGKNSIVNRTLDFNQLHIQTVLTVPEKKDSQGMLSIHDSLQITTNRSCQSAVRQPTAIGNAVQKAKYSNNEKVEKQKKQDQAFKQRQKERDEKEEQNRINKELIQLERARQQKIQEIKVQQLENLEQKKKSKLKLMGLFRQDSITQSMGKLFKSNLQQQVNETKSENLNLKQKARTNVQLKVKKSLKSPGGKPKLFSIDENENFTFSPSMTGKSIDLSEISEQRKNEIKIEEGDSDQYEDLEPISKSKSDLTVFDNFDLSKLLYSKQGITISQVDDQINQKVQMFYDSQLENTNIINEKFNLLQLSIEKEFKNSISERQKLKLDINIAKQMVLDLQKEMKEIIQQAQKANSFEISIQGQAIDLEKKEMEKQRIKTKNQVNNEILKLKGLDINSQYEFKRINGILQRIKDVQKVLLEDQILAQMILEQDLIDKKNINLMGYKKNQQIIGTNQYAMQNNFSKSGGTVKNSENKNFWELRNKEESYKDVVSHPSVTMNDNIRGKDKKSKSVMVSIEVPPSDNKDLNKSMIAKSLGEMQQQYNDQNQSFIQKYQNCDAASNVLQIDQNCASCNGFSPSVISHIKLACLSYVNQPLQYLDFKFQFYEFVQIKEYLLQNCQIYLEELQEFEKTYDSKYGIMKPNPNSCFIIQNGPHPIKKTQDHRLQTYETSDSRNNDLSKRIYSMISDDGTAEPVSGISPAPIQVPYTKYQISTLNSIVIQKDVSKFRMNMKDMVQRNLRSIHQVIESRNQKSVNIKAKSIQLTLNQIKDDRMRGLHNFFDVCDKQQEQEIKIQNIQFVEDEVSVLNRNKSTAQTAPSRNNRYTRSHSKTYNSNMLNKSQNISRPTICDIFQQNNQSKKNEPHKRPSTQLQIEVNRNMKQTIHNKKSQIQTSINKQRISSTRPAATIQMQHLRTEEDSKSIFNVDVAGHQPTTFNIDFLCSPVSKVQAVYKQPKIVIGNQKVINNQQTSSKNNQTHQSNNESTFGGQII